jgi:hypothetical protein
MSQAQLLAALPEPSRKHLDPQSPVPMRMMAAKGMAPLSPTDTVIVVAGLSLDADEKLAGAAQETLGKLPDRILSPALDATLPPAALAVLGPALVGRDPLLEKLVLNRATPDDTVAAVVVDAGASVAEIVASNQERCLRSEPIVRAVAQNANILRSSLDRLFDFLVRAGVILDGMSEFADAMSRLSPTEMQETADKIQLPPDVSNVFDLDRNEEPPPPKRPTLEEEAQQETRRVSTMQLVNSLNVAQRVALALRGNREARTLLVRDTNRVVAAAAIRSPRLTEPEVISAAQSRQVSDEVIRIIAHTKEMVRSYGVKLALVNNPKTPQGVALRFLVLLRASDLKAVAKSKNVPAAISGQAKKMLAKKSGARR